MRTHQRFTQPVLAGAGMLIATLLAVPATSADDCLDGGQTFLTTDAADGDAPFTVRICDVDGDGDADLLTANDASDTVSVLLNNGAGSFGSLRRWPVGSGTARFEPVDVTCCDFDNDGAMDIITVNRTTDNISILFGQGPVEGVPQFAGLVHYAVGEAPWAVRCAPINTDTHLDLVVANFTSDTVSVLINDGFGAIAASASYDIPVGDAPRSLALCDIDGDADLDVVTGNLSGKTVTVLRNDGAIGIVDTGDVALNVNPFGIACCELDGLPGPDVVTANVVDDSVTVLLNDGGGRFLFRGRTRGANGATDVTCADFDQDGDLDVATANISGDDLTVFYNRGTGDLDPPLSQVIGVNPSSITSGIFAGAGPDLAVAFADGVSVWRNACAVILDGDGDGDADLQDFGRYQACFGRAAPLADCAWADVDGSGDVDLHDYGLAHDTFGGPSPSR